MSITPLNNAELKTLGETFIDFKDNQIKDLATWISHFPDSGRCPKGQKDNFSKIKQLKKCIDVYNEFGIVGQPVAAIFTYWDKESIHNLVDTFLSPTKRKTISAVTHNQFSFLNKSAISQKAFLQKVKDIIPILDNLSGFHAKAVEKPLEIHFKKPADIGSKAKYISADDQVWVNSQSKSDNDLYGHLKYILVHEIGHRFENLHGLPDGWNDARFYTTKYSHHESFSSSEAFAEVFAVSNWPDKYEQYTDQIMRFNRLMTLKLDNVYDSDLTP